MTKIEITIQDGKVTWVDQKGDELPYELSESLMVAIANVFNAYDAEKRIRNQQLQA